MGSQQVIWTGLIHITGVAGCCCRVDVGGIWLKLMKKHVMHGLCALKHTYHQVALSSLQFPGTYTSRLEWFWVIGGGEVC